MLRILFFLLLLANLHASDFKGWEGLRVLPLEGGLAASDSGDFDGSGKDSLFIANRRQSRIDIYSWLPKGERKNADIPESPNELPMAPDFDRKEIILERPPFDIQLQNIDDDKELELLVLTTLPLTLHSYDYKDKKWQLRESWKLPNINIQSLSFLYYKNSVLNIIYNYFTLTNCYNITFALQILNLLIYS